MVTYIYNFSNLSLDGVSWNFCQNLGYFSFSLSDQLI